MSDEGEEKKHKDMCLKIAKRNKIGKVNYATRAGMAAFNRFASMHEAESCKLLPKIATLMTMIPQNFDFCSHVPAKWRTECIDRQFMTPAKFEYTQMSEADCSAGGFKWDEYTGCSSAC